ncbi:ABCB family ABC transporter ATP-binding protein/permease [Amphiplicatus metriothermophilus]|uniref:ATP-binding cassette, subfamily B n=1 Tax=Amphiplicatus metriothermophilus TaxID=1519374 RepID=A0A239PY13_9PROT|nr:ABC transporter ATP-binding protein/permease [Amphiplicatus metriothermophilus]MBB5519782.1 ATP-binding cassette subfamily B protein [Amphiplicatus metriothermophilus]SNT75199.1 ATP-binding cassette, subfamily B [Amphiplicatus metriothermophilus]
MTAAPAFDEVATKPQSFVRAFFRMTRALWRPEMKRWRPRMALALLVTVAAKGLAVAAPVLLGDGINRVVAGADGAERSFVLSFLLFAAARFLSNGLPQLRDAFFYRVTQDANRLVAVEAFAHAQAQSLQFHLTRRAGALNRIIERGAGAMEFMLRFLAFNIGPTIVELALAAAVMAALYSWSLGLAAVATVAAYAVFTVIVTERRNALRRAMNEADTELRAISLDTLANFETVKAFAAEGREAERYDRAMQVYNDRYVKTMQSLSFLNAGQEFVMTAGLLAAALIAAFAVRGGTMQAGDITAVILMLTNIYRPLNILGFAWREIKQGAVDIEKLFELLDARPDIADAPDAVPLVVTKGEICFEKVRFAHVGRQGGLDGVGFTIPGGAFVGVVGPSGAGKSTILRLLFRFYDPDSGRILIDGQDVRGVTQASLRRAFGLVPQEVVLFNDTLRFNLSYARPEASEAEIVAAARRAQLGAFIESLPMGLDTRVGERGLKLSGGEKQRVGVARAILFDPPILALDEATSSLDSETEKEVQTALAEAARGRTTIAVAHRLSTIAGADLILVLDQGRIVEQGRHESLLACDGLYAALWRRQTADSAAEKDVKETATATGDHGARAAPAALSRGSGL